jgi:glycosyltransferase involved in cell wall biosynthesis
MNSSDTVRMKILTVSHSDSFGDPAVAAHKLHTALRRAGVDSTMLVNHEGSADWTVSGPSTTVHRLMSRVAPQIASQLCKLHKSSNPIERSPAIVPSPWVDRINASNADLVHLHWVQSEMLTIGAIGRIAKPIVWTLHDMWPFCGTEHFAADQRWREGYLSDNRPLGDRGWDIDRWAWRRKLKAWRKPFNLIAPSQWLATDAKQSALLRNSNVTVIPNALDTESWAPVEKSSARELLSLPEGAPVLALGAWSYAAPNKGFDLLMKAVQSLRARGTKLHLLVIGQDAPQEPIQSDYSVCYTGPLYDTLSRRIAYSAADVMVVPSRMESFAEEAVAAQACGTPVVAFDANGVRDCVAHRSTGYLAVAFDSDDLARGIEWVLANGEQLNLSARKSAVERFSFPVVAAQHLALYAEILAR